MKAIQSQPDLTYNSSPKIPFPQTVHNFFDIHSDFVLYFSSSHSRTMILLFLPTFHMLLFPFTLIISE